MKVVSGSSQQQNALQSYLTSQVIYRYFTKWNLQLQWRINCGAVLVLITIPICTLASKFLHLIYHQKFGFDCMRCNWKYAQTMLLECFAKKCYLCLSFRAEGFQWDIERAPGHADKSPFTSDKAIQRVYQLALPFRTTILFRVSFCVIHCFYHWFEFEGVPYQNVPIAIKFFGLFSFWMN